MKGIVFCLLGLLIGVESSGQLVRRKDYDLAVALQAGGGTSVGIPFRDVRMFVVPVGGLKMTQRVADKSLAPGDHGTTYGGNPFVGAAVSAVFDQFKACDILGHVKEVAPYLEQKLDELVEKYDFLITRRGKGLMQGVVCKLPVGKVAAAALEQGLIVITAGADVLRFVPPLVIEKQHVDEMIEKLEKALLSVQE